MKGSKIVVLKMNEIVKMAIFAVIGIMIVVALIFLFKSRGSSDIEDLNEEIETSFIPGTYSSVIALNVGEIGVLVTVSEDEILDVSLDEILELHEVFYPLLMPTMETLKAEILDYQTADIQIFSENEFTGKVLLNAVKEAIAEARVR